MDTPRPAAARAPVPLGLHQKWSRTPWVVTTIFASAVFVLLLVVGSLGIDEIESTLDAIGLWCLIVIVPTFWIGSLAEALRAPDWLWVEASRSKPTFVVLMVFLCFLGSVLYLIIARPALRRTAQGYPPHPSPVTNDPM